ncbi:hypothetical protein BDV95DRAFT_610797 [Massariosphaeria phaeospora]|uniref:Response regulatory domain-containing protein n=1 Tax=Massariosphaeria phaeospora TaxID=100035 RepID=A0A7C8I0G8_9PLEO|nr:hypothetical protein BDV95DRAFT_610797 [Massariosphaeria phaeospora]
MSSFKARLSNARSKLLRRTSATSTTARSIASSGGSDRAFQPSSLRKSISLSKLPAVTAADVSDDQLDQRLSKSDVIGHAGHRRLQRAEIEGSLTSTDRQSTSRETTTTGTSPQHPPTAPQAVRSVCPAVTLEEPTPIPLPVDPADLTQLAPVDSPSSEAAPALDSSTLSSRASSQPTPPGSDRRQSSVTTPNVRHITKLLDPDTAPPSATATDYFTAPPTSNAAMQHRKIWVKRPNASATLVQICEDDMVDDVRGMILKKYANSLGRTFDSPDITLRICPRDGTAKSADRLLDPEEDMCRTLDTYYPGGQTVNDALLIDVPQRRTPKPSPRVPVYYAHHDESRPLETATEYFPPMAVVSPSPAALTVIPHESRMPPAHPPHSIAVLQTGQLPPLPSPGGGTRRAPHGRPKYPRHITTSPTTLTNVAGSAASIRPASSRPRHDSTASDTKHPATGNAPIPTPPIPPETIARQNSTPPTPRVASPRPDKVRKKPRKAVEPTSLQIGPLDGSVPPINVLIVEDNVINLRVLGAFMQRLKVRWQRAMNGKEAVTKWRAGGFHLVLMDIQLPIMNGLEATKEIRRLERVNNIGVFTSGSHEASKTLPGEDGQLGNQIAEDDKLGDKNLFKSPVIIVALTASSLQSDRHEALAAGCNDFLTKPVSFVWLERKVKEWGCMQALIDFDGWRKWKDFATKNDASSDTASKLSTSYSSIAPRSGKAGSGHSPTLTASAANGVADANAAANAATVKAKDEGPVVVVPRNKRRSVGIVPPPALVEEDSVSTPELGS